MPFAGFVIEQPAMRSHAPACRPAATGALLLALLPLAAAAEPSPSPIVMVVQGGAGTLRRSEMKPETEAAYRAKLEESLRAGHAVLARGGASVDAVEAAIVILEDSPLFNCGKGAVFNAEGKNEMDASIMEGHTRRAGAVTGVTRVKNPIRAARAVMERTTHVMIAGPGADAVAQAAGLELVPPEYFFTERRWKELEDARARDKNAPAKPDWGVGHGTVGAVALDAQGHLAAGTSTGGRTNKLPGRVGDTPILGHGTWADDNCAASGTGHGEFFMRYVAAYDVCSLVAYKGLPLSEAASQVIEKLRRAAPDTGGLVALARDGSFAMPFNTEGMYRGWIRADGVPHVEIYKD
jgi:beta-aspartyl-peptidase (threonine type)